MAEVMIDRVTREMIYGKEAAARHPPSEETVMDQLMRELMVGRKQEAQGQNTPGRFGNERTIWPENLSQVPKADRPEVAPASGRKREEVSSATEGQAVGKPQSTGSQGQSMQWNLMRELARDVAKEPVAEITKQQTLRLDIARQLARDVSLPEQQRMNVALLLVRDTAGEQITQLTRHQTQRTQLLRELVEGAQQETQALKGKEPDHER